MSDLKLDFDVFFEWLEQYKENINQLVSIALLFGDEYPAQPEEKHLSFWGDIDVKFVINGHEFNITAPCEFSLKNEDGKLVMNLFLRDFGLDQWEYYESLFKDVDVNKIPKEKFDVLVLKMDQEFHRYFNVEKVPMWKDRLINSLVHDDFLTRLNIEKPAN